MGLLAELKRRNVIRVGAAYLALSWLLIQIVDTIGPDFGLPDGSVRIATVALAILFLPVMIFTWSFDLTAEGIKRDSDVDREAPAAMRAANRLDRLVIVFLVLATGYFAFDKFILAPERIEAITTEAREEGRTEGIVGAFGEQSIAVLPFDDLSGAGDQQSFADGISEELLNLLAKVQGLRVTARTSSFAFRDQGLGVPEIAAQLGVKYVLEGSVRKAGDTVRITAQLIDADADAHVWSDTFDREFEFGSVFVIQDEISTLVVDALKIRIFGDVPAVATTTSEAYELYLEGLPLLAERDSEGLAKAEEIFEQVIERDPDYAPAYASYAATMFWQGGADERDEEVIAAAQRALEIDPRNADALALLGRKYDDTGRPEEAKALLRQAVEVNPSHANAWRWLGTLHTDSDPHSYLKYAQRAFELNPTELTIRYHTGLALALVGRYDESMDELEKMFRSGPEQVALSQSGMVSVMAGRLDHLVKSGYLGYRKYNFSPGLLIRALRWLGEADLSELWLEAKRQSEGSDSLEVIYGEAYTRFHNGDRDGALLLFIDASERELFPPDYPHLGVTFLTMGGDLDTALADFERILSLSDREQAAYLKYEWEEYLYYGIALYRNGDVNAAAQLLADTEAMLSSMIHKGVSVDQFLFRLHESLAHVYVTRGEYDMALDTLRQGAAVSWLCLPCLQRDSYYDPIRDMPEFQEILADVERWARKQRDRLAEEGMLLTPEEILALENFDFDPFESGASQ